MKPRLPLDPFPVPAADLEDLAWAAVLVLLLALTWGCS